MVKAFGYRTNGGPDVQDFLDIDMPTPLAADLLIEVRAAAVNPVDWKLRSGMYGAAAESDLPAILGREASGVVREVGQDVEGFAVGDEVFGMAATGSGTFAEYTLLNAAFSAKKPPNVSFTDAATLAVGAATGFDGITQLDLHSGQTLLINGVSGGVGVVAAQLARDLDVFVIGTAREVNRPLVESLGATLVPYGEGVADRVRELMPDGVDAIFDLAGGDALRAVAELVTDRRKMVSAGDPATVTELGGLAIERNISSSVLDTLVGMLAEQKVDPRVEDIVPLDQAADAMAAVEVGHAKGKVVIEVG